MNFRQPANTALYCQPLSTRHKPLLWFFALALFVLGLLSARACWLQQDPVLQLVLGWVSFILLATALPTAFFQQQCWLDPVRQQFWLGRGFYFGRFIGLWRWQCFAFADIKALQLYQLQSTRWHQVERQPNSTDIAQHYLAYLQPADKTAPLLLASSSDQAELRQQLPQYARQMGCKFQDFSHSPQKSRPDTTSFNFMRVLILLLLFVLINFAYIWFRF